MALKINNTEIASGKTLKVMQEVESLTMFGDKVWESITWETVFKGPLIFTDSDSLTIDKLQAGDEVEITAEILFRWYNDDELYETYTGYLNGARLPCESSFNYTYVTFECVGKSINFVFHPFLIEYKGVVTYQVPEKLTITEIRRGV